MPHALLLRPGTTLGQGRYVIQRLIHQGRSSLTLQASQVPSGKIVILKLPIQTNAGLLPFHRQRFQQIWQRSGHFQHPRLQQTLDCFEEAGLPILVLEPIPGESLAHRLLQGALPEAVALRCIIQAGQAVQQLHDRGLVHGDISPQNLICHTQSKTIVLVDWGVFGSSPNPQVLAPYHAPEPLMPQEMRINGDVYSLAACLYALVTGQTPLAAVQRITSELILPQSWCPDLSAMTQDAILQGMSLDPDLRPAHIQSWLTLLPSPDSLPQHTRATIVPVSVQEKVSLPPQIPAAEPAYIPIQPPETPSVTSIASLPPNPISPMVNRSHPADKVVANPPLRRLHTSLMVMTIAGLMGFILGGTLRWQQTQSRSATPFFEQEQSFPSQDWPGTLELEFPADAPIPENNEAGTEEVFVEADSPAEWVIPSEEEGRVEEPVIFTPETTIVEPLTVEPTDPLPETEAEVIPEDTENTDQSPETGGNFPINEDLPPTTEVTPEVPSPDPGTESVAPSEPDLDAI